jgi:alginate O-acetyltransferase complex protein AlgI
MLFNSYVFLFAFLPVTLLGFFFLSRWRGAVAAQLWLTLASIAFYGWSGWRLLPLLFASILINFTIGRGLIMRHTTRRPTEWLLAFGILFNLLLLGYFKYAGFLTTTINALADLDWHLGDVVLPVGISFYTFTQVAFLVDAARGEAREYDLPRYALFVSFFPHLIAGPIIHHKDDFAVGATLFTFGLFKKVAFADRIAPFASPVFAAADAGAVISAMDAWIAVLAYTAQIYFDFSAYSDMAIGLSRMFGIHLPLNFNSPYKALSAIDFWRRWHMTLSRFLRDYLYFPLGGNRKGSVRRYVNLAITMLLGGLWHGAGWTFVIWGALHGLYLIVNHAWRATHISLPKLVSWVATFSGVVVAWIFFRAHSFGGALAVLQGLVGQSGYTSAAIVKSNGLIYSLGLLAIAWFAPNTQQILRAHMPTQYYAITPQPKGGRHVSWSFQSSTAFLGAILLLIAVLLMPKGSDFLYFQF